jgi:hypothetical protein
MDSTALLTLITAAFGGLWLYFRTTNEARLKELRDAYEDRLKDRDGQIADLKAENGALEAKVDGLNQIVAKNTDALEVVGETQQAVAQLMGQLMASTSPPSPTAPTPPAHASPDRPMTS